MGAKTWGKPVADSEALISLLVDKGILTNAEKDDILKTGKKKGGKKKPA